MAQTNYSDLRDQIQRFHTKMNGASSDLSAAHSSYSFDTSVEPMGFYLTKTDLSRISTIANSTGCTQLIFMYGVNDDGYGHQNFTVIILGADSNGDILAAHKSNTLKGEQKWPDKCLTLDISDNALNDFLT